MQTTTCIHPYECSCSHVLFHPLVAWINCVRNPGKFKEKKEKGEEKLKEIYVKFTELQVYSRTFKGTFHVD